MRRGLKPNTNLGNSGAFKLSCTDLPDEEGTETDRMRMWRARGYAFVAPISPMRRGLKRSTSRSRRSACSRVAPISPMRRGLKRGGSRAGGEAERGGCTDLPDEEGTETLMYDRVIDGPYEVAPISPMRRGLKREGSP